MRSGNIEFAAPPRDRFPSKRTLKRVKKRLQKEPLIERAYLASITSPRQPESNLQLGLEFKEGVDTDAPIVPVITEQLWNDLDPLIRLGGGILLTNLLSRRGCFNDYVREIPCIYDANKDL